MQNCLNYGTYVGTHDMAWLGYTYVRNVRMLRLAIIRRTNYNLTSQPHTTQR